VRFFTQAGGRTAGELDHVNTYTLVVAVALSAQATEQREREQGHRRAVQDRRYTPQRCWIWNVMA
jgi:endonuclease III